VLALAVAGAYIFWPKRNPAPGGAAAGPGRFGRGAGPIPVVGAKARQGDIPVYFTALGAVTPIYTVDVKSRVDGELMEIHYKEGDLVHQGDPLVEIDPRPFQVQLTQAQGQLTRDQALLANARIDLARYKTLLTQNAIPEQQVATQEALVRQDEGIVTSDQGAIDSAKLNLTYSHITAPINGRVGLRLVDPGNIVHASDSNPLLVITQIQPISVIFTLSEDQLPEVRRRLRAGQRLETDAYDRTYNTRLARGVLTTIDNQIDQTTGTVKLRATFDNRDNALFPNQFVNARLLVELKRNVTLVPTAAIQRNSQSTYVFLVKPDSSVTVRAVDIGTTEGDDAEVTSGLAPGDVVVMTGVDKLQEGSKVIVHFGSSAQAPAGKPGPPAHPAHNRK
jgi:membrane fusion protein, multidrug efflux system